MIGRWRHNKSSLASVTNHLPMCKFDEGHHKEDPIKAQNQLNAHYAILEDKNAPVQRSDNPILYVFQTIWDQFKKNASFSKRHLQYRHSSMPLIT